MYRISGEKVIELFYQEPRFGFSGLKTSERLEAAGISAVCGLKLEWLKLSLGTQAVRFKASMVKSSSSTSVPVNSATWRRTPSITACKGRSVA